MRTHSQLGLGFWIPDALADVTELTITRRLVPDRFGAEVASRVTRTPIQYAGSHRFMVGFSWLTDDAGVFYHIIVEVCREIDVALRMVRAEDWKTPVYILFAGSPREWATLQLDLGSVYRKPPSGMDEMWSFLVADEIEFEEVFTSLPGFVSRVAALDNRARRLTEAGPRASDGTLPVGLTAIDTPKA